MDDICRLCCSSKFVNNYIFDDENALFIKMSLYLPIKVFRDDQLPQKICDRCSCKVNDFYQFCNETIEVQNRLKGLLQANIPINQSVDLTVIKQDSDSPIQSVHPLFLEKSTQTDSNVTGDVKPEPITSPRSASPSVIKTENDDSDDFASQDVPSDDSEDELLIELKKKKKGRKPSTRNGEVKEVKRGKKKKVKHVNWAKENGDVVSDNGFGDAVVKQEDDKAALSAALLGVTCKQESLYCCCMCFEECGTRGELLQHYHVCSAQDARAQGGGGGAGAAAGAGGVAALSALSEGGARAAVGGPLAAPLLARRAPLPLRRVLPRLPRPLPDPQARVDTHCGRTTCGQRRRRRRECGRLAEAIRLRHLPRGVRVYEVPAVAPHARAPRGREPRAAAALRRVRAHVRARQLAAAAPARALRRAQLPVQRVRQGAVVARAPQVPSADTHGLQAAYLQDVRQGVREEVQPDAARSRALGREAARVLALRQGLLAALHARHTREVSQRRAPLLVRLMRPRLRGQGPVVHAPQERVRLAARARRAARRAPAAPRPLPQAQLAVTARSKHVSRDHRQHITGVSTLNLI